MIKQCGFDFGDTPSHTFVVHPVGTFIDPERTSAEFTAYFAKAESALLSLAGPARALFRMGIDAAKGEQARFDSFRDEGSTFDCGASFDAPEESVEAFIRHCKIMDGTAHPGFEYKTRKTLLCMLAAMYVENIGTLLVWSFETHISVQYTPYRDSFFLPGYQDDAPVLEASIGLWRKAYCADKLAYSGKGIAAVKSCTVNGRRYIVTGISSVRNKDYANAWTFCRIEDWTGETFNYQSHGKARDDGQIERGDYRGTVVSVDGQLCVIDGYATIFGDNADKDTRYLSDETDVDDQPENVADFVEEEELELA